MPVDTRGAIYPSLLTSALCSQGTTLHPQLCLALDQPWLLSTRKEVGLQVEDEQQEGSDEYATSLIIFWPSGSCIVIFG